MSKYTFVFKKNDIVVEFITSNKELIEKQMKIWITCASVYAQSQAIKEPVKQLNKDEAEQKLKELRELVNPNVEEISAPIEKPVEEHIEQEKVEQEKVTEEDLTASEQEITESFTKREEQERTLNTLYEPLPEKSFTELLESTIEHSTYQPEYRRDENFIKFVNEYKIENFDINMTLLLKAIHYLCRVEHYERVTLKAVNAKLMQNFSMIIEHPVVEEAILKGYIELVPDLTEMAEASEYVLTEKSDELFM